MATDACSSKWKTVFVKDKRRNDLEAVAEASLRWKLENKDNEYHVKGEVRLQERSWPQRAFRVLYDGSLMNENGALAYECHGELLLPRVAWTKLECDNFSSDNAMSRHVLASFAPNEFKLAWLRLILPIEDEDSKVSSRAFREAMQAARIEHDLQDIVSGQIDR